MALLRFFSHCRWLIGVAIPILLPPRFCVGRQEGSQDRSSTGAVTERDIRPGNTDLARGSGPPLMNAQSLYARAHLLLSKEPPDIDGGIADLNEAIRRRPGFVDALVDRGWALGRKRDFDAATRDLSEAIRLAPGSAAALDHRGCIWLAKGNYEKAISDFNETLRLAPRNAIAYYNRASAGRQKASTRRQSRTTRRPFA